MHRFNRHLGAAKERNKVALRLLSILYRALQSYASNATEAQNILTNALELAKEAVSLDIADAESWRTSLRECLGYDVTFTYDSSDIGNVPFASLF